MRIPDLILCGDLHIRDTIPKCRKPKEFYHAQWRKLDFISDLQKQYDCPVLCSGDLFNYWKPSPWLLSKTLEHLPDKFHTVVGNHEMPKHNLTLLNKSGIYTLYKAKRLQIMPTCHWLQKPDFSENEEGTPSFILQTSRGIYRRILVWHVMTYIGEKPWPGSTDKKAKALLKKYPTFDLILTGHNHKSFTQSYEDRLLVNPGSMMRQAADQVEHKPCVWLYYADTNKVTPIYLKIKEGVVNRDYIEKEQERDNRLSAFVSVLNTKIKLGNTFEENVERLMEINKVKTSVKNIVHEYIY